MCAVVKIWEKLALYLVAVAKNRQEAVFQISPFPARFPSPYVYSISLRIASISSSFKPLAFLIILMSAPLFRKQFV